MNPWVAGQQLLVVSLAGGLQFSSTVVDCAGQTRFVLHLYNAVRTVGVMESEPVLETLTTAFDPGPVIWFGAKPTANFLKHWYMYQ